MSSDLLLPIYLLPFEWPFSRWTWVFFLHLPQKKTEWHRFFPVVSITSISLAHPFSRPPCQSTGEKNLETENSWPEIQRKNVPALTIDWPIDRSARTSWVCFDLAVVITHFFSASLSGRSVVNSNCTINGSAPLVITRSRPAMHAANTGPRCARKLYIHHHESMLQLKTACTTYHHIQIQSLMCLSHCLQYLFYSKLKLKLHDVTNLYQGSMTTFPKTSVTSWIAAYYCKTAAKINTHTWTTRQSCLIDWLSRV